MSGYITRQAALDAINRFGKADCITPNAAKAAIVNAPAANVRENKIGYWKYDGEFYFVCSNCGYKASFRYNYCANCGADMKGKK